MGNACSSTEVTTTTVTRTVSARGSSGGGDMRHAALRIEREQFHKAEAGTAHAKIAHKHRRRRDDDW